MLIPAGGPLLADSGAGGPQHAIAMHGEPDLKPDFKHLPYANPNAPRGGRLQLGFRGTFDTLNPYNLKAGSAAHGISTYIYQPLMMRSLDEPFTLYGLLAQTIETNAERSIVTFRLNPKARFSDGRPVTSRDVRFSVELLRKSGRPQHRVAYGKIKSIETPDRLTVRYDLSGANDRELPLILALMPVLPAHATDADHFVDSTLKPPVGSGPYILRDVDPGTSLTFVRNKDYWAKDLPIHRGFYNFDEVRIEYYRDGSSLFQAFKAGLLDYREEGDPTRWLTGYDFPALRDGRIIRKSLPLGGAKGVHGYAFNTRRTTFKDVRVREALAMVFDFEWINTNIYGGLLTRTRSFFDNTPLSAAGRPAGEAEKKLLARWPDVVRKDILDGVWKPPVHSGSGRDRGLARRAIQLLQQAGYRLRNGRQVHGKTGAELSFDILVSDREQERLALIYSQWLRRIGVIARVRLVDLVQYQRRRQKFDFDMILGWWLASNSPGNEQFNRWSSQAARIESSHNLAGVQSPAVDSLIQAIVGARDKRGFTTAVRAYDRVLLSGFYIVPHFHKSDQWFAYNSRLAFPRRLPKFGSPLFGELLDTWWRKPQ
ncbi:MAG: ABC transporter substrate-binding protein [Hyphomicrobiales bacterium]|nr:ABC transporter substrate-binding protein [Hyphomicrobiales bacterium]